MGVGPGGRQQDGVGLCRPGEWAGAAGGGGGVDTKGGFLLYPDISIEQKIFKDIYVAINKGYIFTVVGIH